MHATTRKRSQASKASGEKKCGCSGGASTVKRKEQGPKDQAQMSSQYAAGPVHRLGAQAKLTVGQVGDPYEREADKVAERVASGQPAGDVSRIPAGGLKAQRQEDEGGGDDNEKGTAQTIAQREEDAGKAESTPLEQDVKRKEDGDKPEAQKKSAQDEQPAQRAEDDAGGEKEDAQAKCAACEKEEKAQRKENEDDTPDAQAQRQEDEGDAQAQRQEDEEGADAQAQRQEATAPPSAESPSATPASATGDDGGAIQRQVEDGSDGGAEPAGDEAQSADGGSDPEMGRECDPADGGETGESEEASGETEDAGERLGCGEEGGEGGGAEGEEAPAAAEGGQSCGAGGEETAEGGEGAGGGPDQQEPSAEADPDPGAGAPVPGCAAPVEAAGAQGNESRSESAPTTGQGGGADQAASECGTAQRKSTGRRERLDTTTAARHMYARGAGEPLKANVKHRLEASLGVDVNGIRVHADGNAQAAARALNAKAFTHRNNIFLGAGQSQHDVSLMAHEGTHVLQQEGIARRKAASPTAAGPEARETKGGDPAAPTPQAGDGSGGHVTAGVKPPESVVTNRAPVGAAGGSAAAPGALTTPPGMPALPAGSAGASPAIPGAAPPPSPAAKGAAPEKGDEKKADKKKAEDDKKGGDKGDKKGASKGAAAGGAKSGGADAATGASAADQIGRATGGDAAHPGAAAAATARIAADRSRMAAVGQKLGREAVRQKGPAATRQKHAGHARDAAEAASNAAPSPDAEPRSFAEEARVKELDTKKGGKVEKQTFSELVEAKLAAMPTPRTLEEMDDFDEQEGATGLKQGLDVAVDQRTAGANAPIQGTLDKPLDTPKKRQDHDLPDMPATPASRALRAGDAAPGARAEEEVSLEPNRDAVENELETHRLTKARLEKANDPRFTAVQKSREEVHEHADRAPGAFRREETSIRDTTARQLGSAEVQTGSRMRTAHTAGQATARVTQAVGLVGEALERQRVATDIENIYKGAEKKVREKLDWLAGKDGEEGEVDRRFTRGEESSRENFEDFVDEEMSNWKRHRYGGRASIPLIGGALAAGTWVYDKLAGIDDHLDVVKIFDEGRKVYLSGLRITINGIAGVVESTLTQCEGFIDEGKLAVETYIRERGLTPSLKAVAKRTAKGVFERFDELKEEVNAQREELADSLVDRYRESEEAIDTRIKELQAENRGLVRKFVDKVKEVVAAIRNFRNKIGPILAEAGDVIEEIIDDPIGFLGNLLAAVGRGFDQFKKRIDVHLRNGVVSWLFGTLGSAGVPVKEGELSVGGLILQVLGVTYEKLKARAVRIAGPRAVGVAEAVGERISTLFRDGPGALWEQIQDDIGNLKDTILEEIKSWVITRIITAAVKKLAMMFNPVGAIIQAIITIYNVIMFFLENIDRILDLVRTVVRAAADIVRGKIQSAADRIESAMAQTIPLIIAFLARLVNLGGVADKVRQVIHRFKTKIERAITKFLRKMVGKAKVAARKGIAGAKKLGAAILKRFLPKKRFKAGGQAHTIWFRVEPSRPRPVISSQTQHLSDFLDHLAARKKADFSKDIPTTAVDAMLAATKKKMPKARQILGQIDTTVVTMDGLKGKPNAEALLKPHSDNLRKLETSIAELISEMLGSQSGVAQAAVPQVQKYNLEGMSAPYSSLPQALHDQIDRDHQPQTALLVHIAGLRLFAQRGIKNFVKAGGAPGGIAINLHRSRHDLGRTYSDKGKTSVAKARKKVNDIVKKPESPDQRRAAIVDVLRNEAAEDAKEIKSAVLDKRETNKKAFGDIWRLTPKAAGISSAEALAKKDKIEIAKKVKQQIRTGLDRIKQQDFDRYQNKP